MPLNAAKVNASKTFVTAGRRGRPPPELLAAHRALSEPALAATALTRRQLSNARCSTCPSAGRDGRRHLPGQPKPPELIVPRGDVTVRHEPTRVCHNCLTNGVLKLVLGGVHLFSALLGSQVPASRTKIITTTTTETAAAIVEKISLMALIPR